LPVDNVLDYLNGKWVIKNPADHSENFADRWAGNPELAEGFFAWVYCLRRDIRAFNGSEQTSDLNLATSISENGSLYGQNLLHNLKNGSVNSSDAFLDLIHQGIDRKVNWSDVHEVACMNVEHAPQQGEHKNVAWVNYYQVKIHSGVGLTADDKAHIRNILHNHSSCSAFVLCCNLLLGTANNQMLRECVKNRNFSEVLGWPIIRLAKGMINENNSIIIPSL